MESRSAVGPIRAPDEGWSRPSFRISWVQQDGIRARSRGQRRRWESNPLEPGCSRSPGHLAPASSVGCPRQESNLDCDLRKVACLRHTPRTSSIPRPGVGPGLAASKAAVRPTHSRGMECPRQDSNLDCDLRRVACRPSHSEGIVSSSRGARSRTLSIRVGAGVLSQEDTPVYSGRHCQTNRVALTNLFVSGLADRNTDKQVCQCQPIFRPGCPAGVEPVALRLTISCAPVTPRAPSVAALAAAEGEGFEPSRPCGRTR
jgi:hypothetical protein